MKKIVFVMACFIISAYKNDSIHKISQQKKSKQVKQSASKDIADGKQLITKSDCFTCHRDDFKLVGPAFKDVSKKYAGSSTATSYLANKIIKGGAGVWGEVPMAPHANIAVPDAKKLAKYILTIK